MKKILIIYENTGSGHKKAAEMLADYLKEPYYAIHLVTLSGLLQQENNIFVTSLNFLVKHGWLRLADIVLNFISRIFFLPFFYILYPKKLARSLDKLQPDIIISTADVNRLIGCYAKNRGMPFYIFITNNAAIFVDTLHPYAQHIVYLNETADIIKSVQPTRYFKTDISDKTSLITKVRDAGALLVQYSFKYAATPYFSRLRSSLPTNNSLKVAILGPAREKNFYLFYDRDAVIQQYDLPLDGKYILISNGRCGGSVIKEIIKTIIKHNKEFAGLKLNLIAICADDVSLAASIKKLSSSEHIRIITVLHQTTLAPLYQLADCSIGRGTAGLLMDSIVSYTPPVVLKKIPSNDRGNLDIINKYKIGHIAKGIDHIPQHLNHILTKPQQYQKAIEGLHAQYPPHTAEGLEKRLKKLFFPAIK